MRPGVLEYAGVLVLVMLYGGARLALAPAQMQANHDAFLEASRSAARAGARLIAWAELAGVHMYGEREALVADVQELARQESVYVAINTMGGATPTLGVRPDAERQVENKLWIIGPEGDVLKEQRKVGGGEFEVWSIPGERILQMVETPFGTVAGGICWDLDFPSTVLQAGRSGADILLGPSHDGPFRIMCKEELHAEMAVFRAIENDVSLVRPADHGLSVVSDPYGRILAELPYDPAGDMVITAEVPTRGVTTLYSRIGDTFADGTIAGILVLVLGAVMAGRGGRQRGGGQRHDVTTTTQERTARGLPGPRQPTPR